jgi:hypothetical protein
MRCAGDRSRRAQAGVDERGSVAVLILLGVTAVTVALSAALATAGRSLIDANRARTAADAAALAGVAGGRAAAAEVALANGGEVVSWSEDGGTVTVVVALGDATATARATDAP